MPKRTDLKKIMVIGSGPIIISQACEFDYSGSQACKALREEGYEVILVNSNPATIMTDPEMADRTYIEPLTPEVIEKIIKREKPEALLPTLGGQIGLNIAATLASRGILKKYNVELIGAKFEAIKKAEDRILFKRAMEKIKIKVPKSREAYSLEKAVKIAEEIGYPVVIRPAYTLGGTGGGIAFNQEELKEIAARGISASRIGQVLIEESVIGWKEYELEVMRDIADNVVIICSIENMDPMGIHTGDSITCAPAQTLTDKEYQVMREAAIKIIREIGVETGGSNIQFAINPENGEMVAIEMNPRVSRSSALASKATGFPIAKIAAKLAIGLTLDEIPNDITKKTPASFEPTIDYVVVKIPRWNFDKFPEANKFLTTQMKSVGEVMAFGRTFEQALQKAIRSLEIGSYGLREQSFKDLNLEELKNNLRLPTHQKIFLIAEAFRRGMTIDEINKLTKIDSWFLAKIKNIVTLEEKIKKYDFETIPEELMREAKRMGFSDREISDLLKKDELSVRKKREEMGIVPVYKLVDTCAAEFKAETPYYYSCYEEEDEVKEDYKKKILIISSGPNRIGQGIEFDYCCVQATFTLKEKEYEAIMVNCNPETVSTDYDTPNKLYFEPITVEDVLNVYLKEKPIGVILQFGGQTPLNLAKELEEAGIKILGTSSRSIDLTEDREKFRELMFRLKIPQPKGGAARSLKEAFKIARKIGYPLMVRPSYVLGGRGMEIIFDDEMLRDYVADAKIISPQYPILIDKFLENAIEVEVDLISDGKEVFIPIIMEHIELAGVHSGDAACVIPPKSLSKKHIETIEKYTKKIARRLRVVGLANIQYAVCNDKVYILEANPRASRTVPFVSKVIGIPLTKIATEVILGEKLRDKNLTKPNLPYFGVKEAVFSFNMFPEVDPALGPEMKSTGEVLGLANSFGLAFFKAQEATGLKLPTKGTVLISVAPEEQKNIVKPVRIFQKLGFKLLATQGTKEFLEKKGIKTTLIKKIDEGKPNVLDFIRGKKIDLVINIPIGNRKRRRDDAYIRREAIKYKIPYITTARAAQASAEGINAYLKERDSCKSLQEYHREISQLKKH